MDTKTANLRSARELQRELAKVIPEASPLREECERGHFSLMEERGLGRGVYGHVYEACLVDHREQCEYAVKVQQLVPGVDPTRELAISAVMGAAGLAPRVHDAWICDQVQSHYHELFTPEEIPEFSEELSFERGLEEYLQLDPSYQDYSRVPYADQRQYLFTVMDKVEGKRLSDYLADQKGGAGDELCAVLLKAITAMHDLGVLHGDLRGDNIFIHATPSSSVRVIILDFGTAVMYKGPVPKADRRKDILSVFQTTRCKTLQPFLDV